MLRSLNVVLVAWVIKLRPLRLDRNIHKTDGFGLSTWVFYSYGNSAITAPARHYAKVLTATLKQGRHGRSMQALGVVTGLVEQLGQSRLVEPITGIAELAIDFYFTAPLFQQQERILPPKTDQRVAGSFRGATA